MVTATTVGYGDKVPTSPAGRLIAMAFMTIGIALFGVLSGHLSASFVDSRASVNAITTVADLAGRRVCGYPYVLDTMIKGVSYTKVYGSLMMDCAAKLKSGEADAVVYDEPVMQYWRGSDPWALNRQLIIGDSVDTPPVGLIFPEGGLPEGGLPGGSEASSGETMTATTELNAMLADLISSEAYRDLRRKWFPETALKVDSTEPIEWPMVIATLVLVVAYVLIQVLSMLRKVVVKKPRKSRSTSKVAGLESVDDVRVDKSDGVAEEVGEYGSRLEAKLDLLIKMQREEAEAKARAHLQALLHPQDPLRPPPTFAAALRAQSAGTHSCSEPVNSLPSKGLSTLED